MSLPMNVQEVIDNFRNEYDEFTFEEASFCENKCYSLNNSFDIYMGYFNGDTRTKCLENLSKEISNGIKVYNDRSSVCTDGETQRVSSKCNSTGSSDDEYKNFITSKSCQEVKTFPQERLAIPCYKTIPLPIQLTKEQYGAELDRFVSSIDEPSANLSSVNSTVLSFDNWGNNSDDNDIGLLATSDNELERSASNIDKEELRCADTSSLYSSIFPPVPDFDYYSIPTGKPYIINEMSGQSYNANVDYENNNSDYSIVVDSKDDNDIYNETIMQTEQYMNLIRNIQLGFEASLRERIKRHIHIHHHTHKGYRQRVKSCAYRVKNRLRRTFVKMKLRKS